MKNVDTQDIRCNANQLSTKIAAHTNYPKADDLVRRKLASQRKKRPKGGPSE